MSVNGSAKNVIELRGSISLPDAIIGKSAYDIAVMNGFEGTEAEWLASLKGEQGEQGEQGDKGDTGAQGEKGEKGPHGTGMYTGSVRELAPESNEYEIAHVDLPIGQSIDPHDLILDANGDVWRASGESSGLAEATGINLKGPQGEQGIQGIQGAKGDKGDTGDKGDKGDTGADGTGLYRGTVVADEESASSDESDIVETIDKPDGKSFVVGDMVLDKNGIIWRIFDKKGHVTVVTSTKGKQGEKGDKGDKGDTYTLTEADKSEIANMTLDLMEQAEDKSV